MSLVVHDGEVKADEHAAAKQVADKRERDARACPNDVDSLVQANDEEQGRVCNRVLEATEGKDEDGDDHDEALGKVV